MTDEERRQKALLAIPYLVRAAQSRKTLTYKELGAKLGVHHRQVGRYIGYIRDEICRPKRLPLLNCLVVNGQSGMPGESWLPGGSKAKTEEGRRREFEEFRDSVFEYGRWNELLGQYGLSPVAVTAEDLNDEARAYNRLLKARGGVVEGDEHRTLKNLIASRPEILGLATDVEPHIEYGFLSGDEVDVAFYDRANGWVVVEVKIGRHRGELVKGIYQAIKYRALAEAQSERKAKAFLVAYDIPKEVAQLAAKHGIDTRVAQS